MVGRGQEYIVGAGFRAKRQGFGQIVPGVLVECREAYAGAR